MIESLLNELVEVVDGATGAIIVAVDGEAVQWGTSELNERLRLRSAYVAVVMEAFRGAAKRASIGLVKHLVVGYKGATLIAQEIGEDCAVVLELKATASVSRAVYQMQPTVAMIREKIAG